MADEVLACRDGERNFSPDFVAAADAVAAAVPVVEIGAVVPLCRHIDFPSKAARLWNTA
jgi:hypothetical protein